MEEQIKKVKVDGIDGIEIPQINPEKLSPNTCAWCFAQVHGQIENNQPRPDGVCEEHAKLLK